MDDWQFFVQSIRVAGKVLLVACLALIVLAVLVSPWINRGK